MVKSMGKKKYNLESSIIKLEGEQAPEAQEHESIAETMIALEQHKTPAIQAQNPRNKSHKGSGVEEVRYAQTSLKLEETIYKELKVWCVSNDYLVQDAVNEGIRLFLKRMQKDIH